MAAIFSIQCRGGISWIMMGWCTILDKNNMLIWVEVKSCLGKEVINLLGIHPA